MSWNVKKKVFSALQSVQFFERPSSMPRKTKKICYDRHFFLRESFWEVLRHAEDWCCNLHFLPEINPGTLEHQCHIHRQYRSIVFGWLCSRFYQWVKCLHYEETGIDLGNKVLVAKAIFSLPNYFWRPLSWLPGKMVPKIAFVPSKMITKLADSIFISSSSSTSSSYLIYPPVQCHVRVCLSHRNYTIPGPQRVTENNRTFKKL